MNMRILRLVAVTSLLPLLFPFHGMGAPLTNLGDHDRAGVDLPAPPPQSAARITSNAGQCIQFLSVFVPAHGGNYVVGVSFTYRDMNRDGAYTPGADRLDVCVNCMDACGWGP